MQGIDGMGITFFGAALTGALKAAVEQLGALTIGEDPLRIEAIVASCASAAGSPARRDLHARALGDRHRAVGHQGQGAQPAACETARRLPRQRADLCERRADARIFRSSIVVKAAPKLVEKGFRQMKMQLALPGDTNPAREVERCALMREAIGPDIDLMCDINQRWSVHQAIDIGRRVEDVHLYWLEDVTAHDDYAGLARVADALATPVAGGEYVYGIAPFRHMLEARSVDIVMIDLLRVGRHHQLDEGRRHGRSVQPAGREPPAARDPRASRRRRFRTASRSNTCRGRSSCSRKCRSR